MKQRLHLFPSGRPLRLARWLALACLVGLAPSARAEDLRDLTELSLEELTDLEVQTVSRKSESWLTAPAAVFVITSEDIRRSGVTSLPEALRLAPGLEVSRITGNQWSIGIRGFGSRLARSMLVLVDGRSVYSSLFAGTYWEVQDTLLEDVERIEVVRGPGNAVWGANAVNGVINVITKSAAATQGALVTAGGGTHEQGFAGFRYGGAVGEQGRLSYRVYGKLFNRIGGEPVLGGARFDDWRMGQVGMRTDFQARPHDLVTLQGDLYVGRAGQRLDIAFYDPPSNQPLIRDSDLSGGNVLARWSHTVHADSDFKLQLFYDRTNRRDPHFYEERDTFDVDFDHRVRLPFRQDVVWGVNYRVVAGRTDALPTVIFRPRDRTDNLWTGFIQDEIALVQGKLFLTAGTKIEHNDYTGLEVQPTGRLAYHPTPSQTFWGAFSRAVRTPSRVEHDLELTFLLDPSVPQFTRIIGTPAFTAEKTYATEFGWKTQLSPAAIVSVAAFYNVYPNLLSLEPGNPFDEMVPPPPHRVVPYFIRNGLEGRAVGFEIWSQWAATHEVTLIGSYAFRDLSFDPRPGSVDRTTSPSTEGSSPQHQVSLQIRLALPRSVELDAIFRFVDSLPAQSTPEYANLDLRLGWTPVRALELSVVGQNLLEARHVEFAATSRSTSYVERGVYGKVTSRW